MMSEDTHLKVTLVYPGIAGYGFNSLAHGMEAGWVSHGLAHLSSAAQAAGFDVDLLDLRALSDWDEYEAEVACAPARRHRRDHDERRFQPGQ